MEIKQILDAVHGPNADGRKKTRFGLFYEMNDIDGNVEEVEHLFISKPIINVSRVTKNDYELVYCFEFVFRSYKDEDYKQMWRFLDHYASDSLDQVKEDSTKIPVLTLSIFPDALEGEYFILASLPLLEMIEKTEHAGIKTSSIRLYFEEECVQFLQNDPDSFNIQALRDEIVREQEKSEENVNQESFVQ